MFYEIDIRMLKRSIKVALKSYKSVLAENFNPIDFM